MTGTDLKHRLAAILAADAVGYSRLMSADERGTVAALDSARAVFRKHIESNLGRVIDMAGDSVLAIFDLATGAVSAALAIQTELHAAAQGVSPDQRMLYRIGVHTGEIIEKSDGTVYGDGVNVAARLEALAEAGTVCMSEAVRSYIRGKVAGEFEDLGAQTVKNIAEPVRVFRLRSAASHADPTAIAHAAVRMSAPVPGFGGRPAIAVLPFTNLSGDPDQEYFADGLAEDILTRLAMWRWFPVIARNSSFTFKGRAVNVKEVGRALGARYVLEGSVRRSGDRLRVTGQLIDAETDHHLWAERYDRKLEDLFAIQDELTDGIANALEAVIGDTERNRSHLKPSSSLSAWEACQRGWWHFFRLTRDDFAAAERSFQRAIELDPGSAQPLTGMACLRLWQGYLQWTEDHATTLSDGIGYARRAIQIDPVDSMAYAALSSLFSATRSYGDALDLAQKGVMLNPSNPAAHATLAIAHLWRGEARQAIDAFETTIRVNPNDAMLHAYLTPLAGAHYLAGDYDRAAQVARLALRRAPEYPIAWFNLCRALGQLGSLDEARDALAKSLAFMPILASETALRKIFSYKNEADFQHVLEGLRKAGWQG